MKLLLPALLLAFAQQPSDRADVTFQNQSSYKVYVFVKENRQWIGPIKPRESLLVDGAFKVGINPFVVVREKNEDEGDQNSHAMVWPSSEVVYRAAEGRPLRPVNIDIPNKVFQSIRKAERTIDLRVENNTDYTIELTVEGIGKASGLVSPVSVQTFEDVIELGKNRILVVAKPKKEPTEPGKSPIVDVAFIELDGGRKGDGASIKTLVITDKSFGPQGLPRVIDEPIEPPKPSINGSWKMPDGPVLRIEGSNGYWEELAHLANFGFKKGELGVRNIKEDPQKPGAYTAEVLYRFQSGEEDGWKPMTFDLIDANTIQSSGGEWKRVE